jgi:hypothetical protein
VAGGLKETIEGSESATFASYFALPNCNPVIGSFSGRVIITGEIPWGKTPAKRARPLSSSPLDIWRRRSYPLV